MNEQPAWLARSRPNGGTLPIAIHRCEHCGRELYATMRTVEWGKDFCRGCDEPQRACYCPETRQVA